MLNCPSCSYGSPDSARFCRQCGAPLPAESELTESTTQHYSRREPIVAAAPSAPLPPSIGDAVAGETARYQQPLQVVPSAYMPPDRVLPVVNTASLRPKRRYLKWGGLVLALLISGGIGAALNQGSNSRRIYLSPEDRVRLERLRMEDQVNYHRQRRWLDARCPWKVAVTGLLLEQLALTLFDLSLLLFLPAHVEADLFFVQPHCAHAIPA